MKTENKIIVAFSGGLDTTYCVAWLKEATGAEILTATVDTGGFSKEDILSIEKRSREAGAAGHILIDGREAVFEKVVKNLICGNCLRGGVYPLCVSAERIVQAELLVKTALDLGVNRVAHGSTGAGNDQVRFDVVIRTLAPDVEILTPIRDKKISREEQTAWLNAKGISVSRRTKIYSVNAGLWGTTIGGGETLDTWNSVPDSAYPNVVAADKAPAEGALVVIAFEKGVPVSIGDEHMAGHLLIEKLNRLGAAHGIGRGVHVGDTILGIKGRIAFEAPAATILINAHRELEKLVLSKWQQFWKDKLSDFYGMLVHEAMFYDPVARDIEAMIESSQSKVTGDVRLTLKCGVARVDGARSPFSLFDARATYGETQKLWNGRDAAGFTKIYGLQGSLAMTTSEKQ